MAGGILRPEALCSRVVRLSVRLTVCLSVRIIFFEWDGKTGRGDDPCQLKKFRQGGHMEGFNKYLF